MKAHDLPPPSRFMFWWTSPFIVATAIVLPLVASPVGVVGLCWLAVVEFLLCCLLFGLYDSWRYHWCLRFVGGIIFAMYVAYLVSTVLAGQWFEGGQSGGVHAINALAGLFVFGYPGLMYAVFGRLTWREEIKDDSRVDD